MIANFLHRNGFKYTSVNLGSMYDKYIHEKLGRLQLCFPIEVEEVNGKKKQLKGHILLGFPMKEESLYFDNLNEFIEIVKEKLKANKLNK